jgi:hypothetical protein
MRPACHKFNADLPLLGTDTKPSCLNASIEAENPNCNT